MWTRDFRLFFTARSVSTLGTGMVPVAMSLGVIQAGYGATGVGLTLASSVVPMALLVLFGGVFADRFTPRRMMVGADIARVLSQATTAVLFLTGTPVLWHLMVISAVNGTAAAMFQPGLASLIPRIATDVQAAVATQRTSESFMLLLGPSVAGILVGAADVGVVFLMDAAGFAVSAVCLALLRLTGAPPPAQEGSVWHNLKEGWHEFSSRTWMWGVIIVWSVMGIAVFGPILPLGATIISAAYDAQAYGFVMSAHGAGTILGGLVAMRIKPVRPLAAGATAMLLYALEPLSIALGLPLPLMLACHVAAGVAMAFWGVMWMTSVQTQVAPGVLNRVHAYEVAGSIMALPIGQALAGPVAAVVGPQELLGASSVISVTGCVVLLAVPAVRRLRRVAATS
ncbi:MFS transporter [Sphaerisporangium siamense]|uniref:Putative MFS family arabinose efflux permease n=1 Tax=Sphaerisporangium siamense TaxID=795645 RepID=A0A7W7D2E0_9ACTN|nr:MFS transporter [Sphaerisporangium siamense]MBB4699013.1 putative MFS family arabinose efflux permease [Sphaerisporangium siamense]GII88458.1 MFS transporter [Sphaerisporangium siamense]